MNYLLLLFSGALLCNGIPLLAAGLRGEPFPTPFARPRGIGESSPLVNFYCQDFELGGAVGFTYDPNPTLSLRSGIAVNPGNTGVPVMPLLNLRWSFADAWTLNFGFPRTSIDYQAGTHWRLSPLKIDFQGGTFKTNSVYGNSVGAPNLNDRTLNYREVRVGAEADYLPLKNVQVGLTTGAVVYREFDFNDASFSPKVDPAPYVQLGVKVGF